MRAWETDIQKEKCWNLSTSSSADCVRILINIPRPHAWTRPSRPPLHEHGGRTTATVKYNKLLQHSNLTPRWPRLDGESCLRLERRYVLAKWKMDIISNMIGLWRKFINPAFILIGHITQGRDTTLHLYGKTRGSWKKDYRQVHYRQNEQIIPAGLIISPRHEMHFNSDSDSRRRYIITQHVDCGHVEGHCGRSFWIQLYDTAASKWTRELISLRYYSSSEGINERPGIRAPQDYFR